MYTFYACTHIHACTAAAAAGAAAAGGAGAAAAAGGAWCGMVRRVLREARGPASGGGQESSVQESPGVQLLHFTRRQIDVDITKNEKLQRKPDDTGL